MPSRRRFVLHLPEGVRPLILALCYLVTALGGLTATRDAHGLAALWPPNAILLAMLLVLRPAGRWRYLAWCACAGFAANIWFGATPLHSLLFTVGNMAVLLTGLTVGVRLGVGPSPFDRPAAVIRFCATAFAAASVSATVVALPDLVTMGPGIDVWVTWFLSDLLGMLVLTPIGLMIAWAARNPRPAIRPAVWETVLLLATALATASLVFLQSSYPLLFLPVAPMMAIAYRLGPIGTAAGIIIIAVVGIAATLGGLGPVALAVGSVAVHVHFLQFYLVTLFAICLPMAAALAHRNRLAEVVRDSEARHRRLVERAHTVIFETDRSGRWTFLNPTWTTITGRDVTTSLGETILAAVAHRDRDGLVGALRALADGAPEITQEVPLRTAGGEGRWVLVTAFPMIDADDRRIGYHGTIEDITERRAAHAAIAASERRYRLLADNAGDMILRIGLDGALRYASPSAERMMGVDGETLLDMPLLAGIPADDQAQLRAACAALLHGAPNQTCIYRQVRPDGVSIWLESALRLIHDDDGQPAEFIATVRDVSRRKIAEADADAALAQLKESHRLLSLAGRVSRVGHWRVDPINHRLSWSDEVFRLHGVPGTVPPPLDQAVAFYHPDDRPMVEGFVADAIGRGAPFQFTARIVRTDGEIRHVVSTGETERSFDGHVIGLFGVIQDVTERMLAEIELRASEQRFRAITEQAGDMITLHDARGAALFVSPSARTMLGHDPREAFGQSPFDWVAPEDRAHIIRMSEALIASPTGQSSAGRLRMRRADDSLAWVEVRARLTEIAGALSVVAVWRDVSDQVVREAELGAARAQAEAALSAKAEFLANMSHEIRTPMNGVIGFTELLLGSALDPEQRRHAQLIADSGSAMMKLLNDILDLSKIDAGQLDVVAEPIDLPHTLTGCTRLLAAAAEQKGLALGIDIAEDLPRAICGDALRIRQVVLNLLGNAIKFTANGSVTIVARRAGDHVRIAIRDTGIGIPIDRQDAIFEQFVQADHSITRAYGGTGLGLAISNRLAHLMGGGLSIDSLPGRGTTITLELPLVELDATTLPGRTIAPVPRAASSRVAHVLLADDHDINQILVTSMLARAGHRVTIAGDGAEALAKVEASYVAGAPFDMVLMDMQMPVLDGLSATRAIRALGGAASTLPIVALTANAFATDLDACRDAGMDDHVAKPVSADQLLAAIERFAPIAAPPKRASYKPSAALIERFGAQKAATLSAIDAAVRTGGFDGATLDDLAERLHKLAGSAAMFGEAALGDHARAFERELRDGAADPDVIRAAADRLRAVA